jgi:hypothetical protein
MSRGKMNKGQPNISLLGIQPPKYTGQDRRSGPISIQE